MTQAGGPPRRRRRGYRVIAGATTALTALVAYIVVASGAAHDREATAQGGAAVAPPPPAVATVTPDVVRTPTLGLSTPTLADLDRFIVATGTAPEVFDVFEAWSRDRPLDRVVADAVAARGARLSITWEPWDVDVDKPQQPAYSLATIIAGRHDEYIDMFARSVADYGQPVTIRLMHEMNGNWYPWSTGVNGNREGEFVQAWQHVHDRFTALGVTDVRWMWAPNAVYTGARQLAPLYPGDAYVDAVGVSNYNWGDDRRDGWNTSWTTFGGLFDQSFAELRSITSRPIWVTETGSSNRGGDKAEWLAAMLAEVAARPDIAGVVWFSHVDKAREVDWRIETEPEAVAAWREGFLARPVVQGPGG
ncbi:glycoside hydrolase family 26 protein [Blastococcus sp. SYSU D00922]